MGLTHGWTAVMRDRIHNLDLSIPSHAEIYERALEETIMHSELDYVNGKPKPEKNPYRDTALKRTVGIGFNMDGAGAETEWTAAFGGSISFDDVLSGQRKLEMHEAIKLLRACIKTRRAEILRYFKDTWHPLKANEKLAIEELFFNGPNLIRHYDKESCKTTPTNFTENMKLYAIHKDIKYLHEAIKEISERSNRSKTPGIQTRRIAEAELLSSDKCPLYSKPGEPYIPKDGAIQITIGETILPYKHENRLLA
ncbi:MAG: hypothetical protein V4485_06585 [Pseudomonadota bacterium]